MAVDHLKQLSESTGTLQGKSPHPSYSSEAAALKKAEEPEPNQVHVYSDGFRDGVMKVLLDLCQRRVISETDIHTLSDSFFKPQPDELAACSSPTLHSPSSCSPKESLESSRKRSESPTLPRHLHDDDLHRKRRRLARNDSDSDGAESESSHSSSSDLAMEKSRPKIKHADSSRASPVGHAQKTSCHGSEDEKLSSSSTKSVPSQDESSSFPQFAPSPHLNPVLLPAYALHASGTHYVPVILPPWGVFNTHSGGSYPSAMMSQPAPATGLPIGVPEFKLAGPNPFFAPGSFSGEAAPQ